MSILFYAMMHYDRQYIDQWVSLAMNTVLILLFVAHLLYYDLPAKYLPIVGRFFGRMKK